MKCHDESNFPDTFFGRAGRAVDTVRVFIHPNELKSRFELPKIGCLYEVNSVDNSQWKFISVEHYSAHGSEEELVEVENRANLKKGEVILCLDYVVSRLEKGFKKNGEFINGNTGANVAYSVLIKALYDTKIIYRSFLITGKYNEFMENFCEGGPSGS